MNRDGRGVLVVAATASFAVALLHIAIIVVGPAGYRYFGAPALADAVERGAVMVPTLLTFGIALVFALWGAYALSGAALIRQLPLVRPALLVIGVIFVARGLLIASELAALVQGTLKYPRALVFSGASMFTGLCYILGAARAWAASGPRRSDVA
jgi:hypothetical protein